MSRTGRTRYLAALAAASAAAAAGLTLSSRSPASAGAGASQAAPVPRIIPVAAREPAPEVVGPSLTGPSPIGTPSAGSVYVLAFWSSWCAPCRSELAQLQTAWRSRPPSTELLGVDVDDSPALAKAALRAAGASFPNIADPSSSLAAAYRIAGTPTLVVIDGAGREAAVALGPTPASTILSLVRKVSGTGAGHGSDPAGPASATGWTPSAADGFFPPRR